MASVKKENNEISAATLRTMPNNFEAEQAVLGAIMSDKDIANEYVANLSVDDFYTPINAIIFERIEELNKASKPTDIVMVSECLAKTQQLDAIGGFSMLADMLQNVFSTANCAEYVKILKQNSLRRNLIRKCNEIIASAYKLDDAEKVLAVAESLIYSVAEGKDTSTLTHVRAASTDLMQLLNMQFMNRSGNSALKVGFENLDEMTGGFVGGQLIILAARPGCGKTSFAMNIAANIAREQKEKVVAIFNLEMSARELAARLISNISRTDSEKLKDGTSLLIDEFTPLWKADAALGQSNIYIDDTAAITVEQIMSKCRRLKSQKGALDLVIVDYMQLMESSMPKATKQQQVSEISRKFKVLAKELKVPVIVLSQMSRDIENREKNGLDATPKLSDLRDSGTIEQDADMVFFLTKGDFELSDKQQG
ncbi:MAG: replicative DNA helicase, partial [Clostridia bacterium]